MIHVHAEARCDFDRCHEVQGADFVLAEGDVRNIRADFEEYLTAWGWFSRLGQWFCKRHTIVTVLDDTAAPCARQNFLERVVNK